MDTVMEVARVVLDNVGGYIQGIVVLIVLLVLIGFAKTIQEFRLNQKERMDAHVHAVAIYVQLVQTTQASITNTNEHELDQIGPQIFAVYELALKHRELRQIGIQALVQMRNDCMGNPKTKDLPFNQYIQRLKSRFI